MNTAALYIRVSTEDQIDYSPDAQKRLLLEYAKKNHYECPERFIYIDEGISGRRADKRPAFMKMIRTAKQTPQPFDTILVHKFDRFSRSREDSVLYKSLLKKEYGIKVISITEHLEDDKFSIILEAILEAMAEYYSLNLSDEVLKGMTEKALQGGYQSAPPYGYEVPHKKAIPIIKESEAAVVRTIFDRYLHYHLSPYEIARALNEEGVRTKRGNPFEKRTIAYILKNPFYAGYIQFHIKKGSYEPILTKGLHQPLVTEENFNKVKEQFANNKKPSYAHSIGSKHWLSGMVKCSSCKQSLLLYKRVLEKTNKTYYNLQCCGYQKGTCSISHHLSEKKLLSTLSMSIHEVYPPSSNVYQLKEEKSKPEQIKILENTIKDKYMQLTRLKHAYLNGIDSLEEYIPAKKAILAEIEKEKDFLSACKEYTPTGAKRTYHTIEELLTDSLLSNEEKSRLIHTLIHHIEYDKEANTLRVYYNDPFYNKDDAMGLEISR